MIASSSLAPVFRTLSSRLIRVDDDEVVAGLRCNSRKAGQTALDGVIDDHRTGSVRYPTLLVPSWSSADFTIQSLRVDASDHGPLSARGIRSSHGSRSRRLHLARPSSSSASPTSLNDTRYGGPLLSPSKFSSTRDQIRMERASAFSSRRFSDPPREQFRKWYNAREFFVFESTDKLII